MISPKKSLEKAKGYDIPLYLDKSILKLDSNENILGPSQKVIDAIKNITEDDIKYYPAYGELINKIAEYNNTSSNMVLPTNGADDAIKLIFDTFIEFDDTVLNSNPTFVMPQIYAAGTGANYKEFNYLEKWSYPVDEIINNIDEKTKLVIVTTPNNPTGDSISRENLIKIIEASKNNFVLIDETYCNYSNEKFTDLAGKYDNVLIIRSFSKDFALAGLRLGYIISCSDNINNLKKIISPYNVNNIAAIAGIAALHDTDYIAKTKLNVDESKKIITQGLQGVAEKIYPSDSNFLLIDFGDKAAYIHKRLLNSGILIKSFANSSQLKTCLRIGMPDPENARKIVNIIKEKRDLIIFDMDGVIIDTQNSYRLVIKNTYEHFSGRILTKEEVQDAKNKGGLNNDWDLTEFLLKKYNIEVHPMDIINKFQELYFGNNGDGLIQNEEILISPETLRNLSKTYDLAIFTGRPKIEAVFALEQWGIKNLFAPVITMDDVPDKFHKPHPCGVHKILNVINPKNTYYLGDTIDDMIAASKSNVHGIGVLPPQDKTLELRQRLYSMGAKHVLEETEHIVEYLDSLKC